MFRNLQGGGSKNRIACLVVESPKYLGIKQFQSNMEGRPLRVEELCLNNLNLDVSRLRLLRIDKV